MVDFVIAFATRKITAKHLLSSDESTYLAYTNKIAFISFVLLYRANSTFSKEGIVCSGAVMAARVDDKSLASIFFE